MLFESHGLRLLADVPQLNHPFIVTTDQVALHIAVPAHAAQFGPTQSHKMVTKHVSKGQHGTRSLSSVVFSIVKGFSKQLLKANKL